MSHQSLLLTHFASSVPEVGSRWWIVLSNRVNLAPFGQLCSNVDQTQTYVFGIYERCIDKHTTKRRCITSLCVLWSHVLGKNKQKKYFIIVLLCLLQRANGCVRLCFGEQKRGRGQKSMVGAVEASLIKNDIAQQKSSVTLTLIHAALTPPCMDLLLKMHKYRDASSAVSHPSFI